jgi:hypothetical protein
MARRWASDPSNKGATVYVVRWAFSANAIRAKNPKNRTQLKLPGFVGESLLFEFDRWLRHSQKSDSKNPLPVWKGVFAAI